MSNFVFTTINPKTNKEITIRRERAEERTAVENLVRDSFWNVYRPGCLEHYVLHQLRQDSAFVPELSLVKFSYGAGWSDYRPSAVHA